MLMINVPWRLHVSSWSKLLALGVSSSLLSSLLLLFFLKELLLVFFKPESLHKLRDDVKLNAGKQVIKQRRGKGGNSCSSLRQT